MWDMIWEMRFRFVLCLRLFRSRDHAWSSHRQFCWSFSLAFWRVTHAHSRLSSDVYLFSILSSGVYNETSLNLTRHLIKLIVSDSSNLTKATHQTWWVKTSSHQIWRERLIKLDERNVISSSRTIASFHETFEKRDSSSIFDEQTSAATFDVRKFSLAKDSFLCEDKCLCEIVMISERS
jgi:hypothetical protein